MLTISSFKKLTITDIRSLGHNGYTSELAYMPVSQPDTEHIIFDFRLTTLDRPVHKTWHTSEEELDELNEVLAQGHSFAAWEEGKLLGFIIGEERPWNNTLYIAQLTVAASGRRKGIGSRLMQAIIQHATKLQVRLLELETQNTNVPAVTFYKKHGFSVSGVHLRLYDPISCPGEVAFYMTYSL
ncbi:GNAT family N-acetyltransferase [Chitinophaga flava]|uniref:N-acetyltransferase n=1 Tax=Chitinophaga flava TaxID=2259036 RepID=A0A365XVJ4_9BACT|nr:GNAT family N-acetyltransferase [Chitinophaga flava]RBL90333.1 N-acetyltransferase [Chitinophaga flava]